jgi:hypothetical protein
MKRIVASFLITCLAIVGVDVHFNESRASLKAVAGFNQAAVAITGGTISGVSIASPTITGTVTANQVTGIPVVLAKWGVPVILASSGTMGNNGAVSAMTALPTTYSGGAWLYLPAGAVAAGEPAAAAFRWFKASSTTAGTVYNSSWDGTGVPPLGTETAYVTTGPGAFTGVAAGEITAATVTLPAGAMGPNGRLRFALDFNHNTAAGNKFARVKFGGTSIAAQTFSTTAFTAGEIEVMNMGVADRQRSPASFEANAAGSLAGALTFTSIDTASAVTILFTLEKATATNHVIWDGAAIEVIYGS